MVVVVQLGERQIVALEVKSSILFDHPITKEMLNRSPAIVGCRQVVRHWTLTPTFRRFESYHPSQVWKNCVGARFRRFSEKHRIKTCFFTYATKRNRTTLAICRNFKKEVLNGLDWNCKSGSIGVSPSGKAHDFDSCIRWFKSSYPCQYGSLAQPVEHLTFNQGVPGSNPGRATIKNTSVFFFVAPGFRKIFNFALASASEPVTPSLA